MWLVDLVVNEGMLDRKQNISSLDIITEFLVNTNTNFKFEEKK